MEHIADFVGFLRENAVERICEGQSGAQVWRLSGGRIAKYVQRSGLTNEGVWNAYMRESMFYEACGREKYPFLPEIMHNVRTDDALLLVMREYRPIWQAEAGGLMDGILSVLARIHETPVPGFIPAPENVPPRLDDETIGLCVSGWQSVLAEHGSAFSEEALQTVARQINRLNAALHRPAEELSHGDFHCGNLLTDGQGGIVVCDWQGCDRGSPAGDLSFLLSRLAADGYPQDEAEVVRTYCRHDSRCTPDGLTRRMRLISLNTAFRFWHEYLHGSAQERVGRIYEKMEEDIRFLIRD